MTVGGLGDRWKRLAADLAPSSPRRDMTPPEADAVPAAAAVDRAAPAASGPRRATRDVLDETIFSGPVIADSDLAEDAFEMRAHWMFKDYHLVWEHIEHKAEELDAEEFRTWLLEELADWRGLT